MKQTQNLDDREFEDKTPTLKGVGWINNNYPAKRRFSRARVWMDAEKMKMASVSRIETVNTRSSPRVKDHARLVVDGQDLLGFPYTEDAQVHDISQTGISFYLKNRPWIEDSLEITIYPFDAKNSGYFSCRKTRGKVVRTGCISQEDKQFVAARFENWQVTL